MEVIPVIPGVTWVDIPEAGLYILCGAPADVMKHLKQKGFIIPKAKNGVYYETGPNAVLLSDVSVQRGQFSNLAEFPLLHMLYFQGMGIPGHVNNKGLKPLLLGSEMQVQAQSKYIYRGRYGLSTLDEIKKSGIPEDWAKELFRIKKKFAFNNIQPSEEVFDCKTLGREPLEIRNGVTVQRLDVNVFRIVLGDESVEVDLNLPGREVYAPAVNLDFHRIRKEYFSVVHLGEGDGWDINQPCMGSLIFFQGRCYLIDAGPFIHHNLKCLGLSINEIDGIFQTHLHDDHFAGLTSLMYTDHKMKYYASPLVRESVMSKLSALLGVTVAKCERSFDIQDLNIHDWNDIDGLKVLPVYSPHPVETNVYLFRTPWEDGHKQYLHLADITSRSKLKEMLLDSKDKTAVSGKIYQQITSLYDLEVDLKKVDIGGGMIHGDAEDFRKDNHSKILLSHNNKSLTFKQKEIGSSASFGMVDILIPCKREYSMRSAYQFLSSYFPEVPEYDKQLLLNSQPLNINVGEIIIKRDQEDTPVYLILGGVVEVIDTEHERATDLAAGSFIGEEPLLNGHKSHFTFRAASYVTAIRFSKQIYTAFIMRNYDIARYTKSRSIVFFIMRTELFGEHLATYKQSSIARNLEVERYRKGELIEFETSEYFYLIREGMVRLSFEGETIERVKQGGFFGEDNFFYHSPLFDAQAFSNTVLYKIKFKDIMDIPIVTWKMQAEFERRMISFGTRTKQGQ